MTGLENAERGDMFLDKDGCHWYFDGKFYFCITENGDVGGIPHSWREGDPFPPWRGGEASDNGVSYGKLHAEIEQYSPFTKLVPEASTRKRSHKKAEPK